MALFSECRRRWQSRVEPEPWAAEWPRELTDLLAIFPPDLVWQIGLQALGYPPTWADTDKEFQAVRTAILEG